LLTKWKATVNELLKIILFTSDLTSVGVIIVHNNKRERNTVAPSM